MNKTFKIEGNTEGTASDPPTGQSNVKVLVLTF